jgi:hypothetical protein
MTSAPLLFVRAVCLPLIPLLHPMKHLIHTPNTTPASQPTSPPTDAAAVAGAHPSQSTLSERAEGTATPQPASSKSREQAWPKR